MSAMNILGAIIVFGLVAVLYIDFMEWLVRPIDISESGEKHLKLAIIWVLVSIVYWAVAAKLADLLNTWIIK